jgi:hypothetical protein
MEEGGAIIAIGNFDKIDAAGLFPIACLSAWLSNESSRRQLSLNNFRARII